MLVLLGILIVVAGFVARINPLVVILVAAIATGVLAAVGPGVDAQGLRDSGQPCAFRTPRVLRAIV